jgi:hypothetical protein
LFQSGFSSTNVVDFEKGMTYFCRISIFAVKNTQKYLVFDPSEKHPYSVCPNYAGSHSPGQTASVKDRIQHRAKHYYFENNLMRKQMPAGVDKIVPEPHLRANLIRATHLDIGHFGIKKTYSLFEPVYIWAGMYEQVRFKVRACAACDRVKASFEVRDMVLKPLPIMGLFFRWGVDLCKMPHTSEDGNKYVMVMIEHFTKWVELVPITEKSSFYTAAALKGVLTRFGAPAEVLTDQGEEFQEEFAVLLQKLLIDHRTTSRDHPQSDGLVERTVQVVKEALRKYCLTFNKQHWCRFLCWIATGYRMSRQRSLGGYSPYFLLFGRWPIVGASVRDVLQKVVDLDSPAEWARLINERAKVFEKHMPIAFNNLAVAQHCDMLRYTKTRSETFAPKLQRFVAGNFVYLKRQKADSLDPRVGRLVF